MSTNKSSLWRTEYAIEIAKNPLNLKTYKDILTAASIANEKLFKKGIPAKQLILERSRLIDRLLLNLWQQFFPQDSSVSLLAVGGYGRGELHPYSDIDLLILLKFSETPEQKSRLASFINFLWDAGLNIGNSVRTIDECLQESKQDVTVFTNILEARALTDPQNLHTVLKKKLTANKIWPIEQFFIAKLQEQKLRHEKYNDAEYELEPNIKQGPGGLRDLQNIVWILKCKFGAIRLVDLLQHDFLTQHEYKELTTAMETLWNVRMALHIAATRAEERILFNYQPAIAAILGFAGDTASQKVENFMRTYYLAIRSLSFLNELLLQLFRETFFTKAHTIKRISSRFMTIDGMLATIEPEQFKSRPTDIFSLFAIFTQNPEIKGVRAGTIRDIRANLSLIDNNFRQQTENKALFWQLFKKPGLTHTLRRMHRYGVLGAYLPDFVRVTGKMQYDLFHTLTIDEHILFTVRNLRRLTIRKFATELPEQTKLLKEITRPELLYLAALFHDMGKGQAGDHSIIGKNLALEFCHRHELDEKASRIVSWLVQNHLLMSITAQRQDIDDPMVIKNFANNINNLEMLKMLYLLTVADIRATNPDMWNDWKAKLLQRLYDKTKEVLDQTKITARQNIIEQTPPEYQTQARQLWHELGANYLQRFLPQEIIWQTTSILQGKPPLVLLEPVGVKGASVLLVYAQDQDYMFANIVGVLEKFPIRILEANIYTADNSYVIDSFQLLNNFLKPISNASLLEEIPVRIKKVLAKRGLELDTASVRLSRHEKHFKSTSEVAFRSLKSGSELKIIASCRPKLLTIITRVLAANKIRVHSAKIATIGEKAEDIFVISDMNNKPVSSKQQRKIAKAIIQILDH